MTNEDFKRILLISMQFYTPCNASPGAKVFMCIAMERAMDHDLITKEEFTFAQRCVCKLLGEYCTLGKHLGFGGSAQFSRGYDVLLMGFWLEVLGYE